MCPGDRRKMGPPIDPPPPAGAPSFLAPPEKNGAPLQKSFGPTCEGRALQGQGPHARGRRAGAPLPRKWRSRGPFFRPKTSPFRVCRPLGRCARAPARGPGAPTWGHHTPAPDWGTSQQVPRGAPGTAPKWGPRPTHPARLPPPRSWLPLKRTGPRFGNRSGPRARAGPFRGKAPTHVWAERWPRDRENGPAGDRFFGRTRALFECAARWVGAPAPPLGGREPPRGGITLLHRIGELRSRCRAVPRGPPKNGGPA